MPRQITLSAGLKDIVLPNGLRAQGGASVILSDQEYSLLSSTFKAANLAADVTTAQNDYFASQGLVSGESTIPRMNPGATVPVASQRLQLTYWTAAKTETVNNIGNTTGSTGAGATPTYCAMGCYSVAANGNLALLGACANDTNLFSTAYAFATRAVTTPFQKVQGQRYAWGILVVTAAATPTMIGYNGAVEETSTAPVLSTSLSGQSVLPSSITAGSLSGFGSMIYGVVTP